MSETLPSMKERRPLRPREPSTMAAASSSSSAARTMVSHAEGSARAALADAAERPDRRARTLLP